MSIGERIAQARLKKGWTQAQLAEQAGVRPQSVQLWEANETAPSRKRIERVASLLETTPEELLFDVPVSNRAKARNRRFFGEKDNVVVSAFGDQMVPIFSYSEAATWTVTDAPYPITDETHYLWTNIENLSERAFALWIEGESMLDEFYPGDLIVIDPLVPPQPGDFVAAHLAQSPNIVFRKYRPRGEDEAGKPVIELAPLNDDYPVTRLDSRTQGRIVGTLVEHRRYRRRNRLNDLKP